MQEMFNKDLEELKNKHLEELKNKQTEMNSTITEMKNTLEGINSRITEAEEWIRQNGGRHWKTLEDRTRSRCHILALVLHLCDLGQVTLLLLCMSKARKNIYIL